MATTFSIENLNLNGDLLTASNGSLYINDVLIKNSSGVQLTDRFFIKGYAPISFYTKWPQEGKYLNETYLNDYFMATGIIVSCSRPTTGTVNFLGAIYERPANSAIDTNVFAGFELQPKQIIQQTSLNYKILKDKIIGLNIYNAPEDMRSISVHLLGYFPAAAHFDRMPKQINFYSKHIPMFSENIYEEYSQWDSVYSGFGIYCSNTGVDNLTFIEPITGYISGILNPIPIYYTLDSLIEVPCDPCQKDINRSGFSGYFLEDKKINFPIKNYFLGFNNQSGFSNISGFLFSGFQIDNENVVNTGIYSGFSDDRFTSGEIYQLIGWRSGAFPEKISGFISGYLDQYGAFMRLSKITTGISGSGTIFDGRQDNYLPLDTGFFKLDQSGFIINASGYFINNKKYFFPADRPISYNLIGFISGYMDPNGYFSGFQDLNIISGSSGYFIDTPSDYAKVFFPTGSEFAEFTGMYGIYTGSGYTSYYTGFSFPLESGFSGIDGATNDTYGMMTGIIGSANILIPFSGFSGRPDIDLGLGFNYIPMHYDLNEDFFSGWSMDASGGNTGQWIGGIGTRNVSGKQNITGFVQVDARYDFEILSNLPPNSSGISGYFFDNKTFSFSSGQFDPIYNEFPEFSNNPLFLKYGYSYSGFYPYCSGFSGVGYTDIERQYIVGFISGFKNELGEFYQFTDVTGSSGFITGQERIFFPTGELFSGFSGFDGFNLDLGFLYTGMRENPYMGNNFIGNDFLNSGSGIITGYIGWRNVNFLNKEYGTGIMTGYIGYKNSPFNGSLSGHFYYKDKYGNKFIGTKFELKTGEYYKEAFNVRFNVPWNHRVGIDVYNPLSGISDINIVLFGYYE